MKKFLVALQFLTIIPVKNSTSIEESEIVKSSSAFVPVGIVQGMALIAVYYAASRVFYNDLATGTILLVTVLYNGGFHLDGLADTFDAIAARGDKEKKLSIMKDSTIGPIGVIAIFFALLLKFLALNNLLLFPSFTFYSSLFLMPVFSKWAMVVSMFHGKPAREDGLGRIFINRVGGKEIALSTLILFISFVSLQAVSGHWTSGAGVRGQYIFYAISVISIYLLCRMSIRFFDRRFGGLTGDTLGAMSEITEIFFLLMAIV